MADHFTLLLCSTAQKLPGVLFQVIEALREQREQTRGVQQQHCTYCLGSAGDGYCMQNTAGHIAGAASWPQPEKRIPQIS